MLKKLAISGLALGAINLTSCTSWLTEEPEVMVYPSYYYNTDPLLNPYLNGGPITSNTDNTAKAQVQVESSNSYYVGANHSPTSFKDRDKNWVKGQNPEGYTIQVGSDEKPEQVAGTLSKVPKDDRSAEVKSQKDGKEYYKGIYGSYENQESAKQALEKLPPEVKSNAEVTNWGSVQNDLVE